MKNRISKATLAQLPANVATAIKDLGADYGIKSFSYSQKPHGYKLYAAEGSRYTVIYGDNHADVQMASESTLGGSGMSHRIGAEMIPPVGAVIIEVWYYAGYGMSVINIGDKALMA